MNNKVKVVTSLAVLAAGIACVKLQARAEDNRAQVQTMIRSAHSPQQYQALATYFRSKQHAMEEQAKAEKAEWDRRSQNTSASFQKYPRPADSSRNRYEYFAYEAEQFGQQAAHYESLLANTQQ